MSIRGTALIALLLAATPAAASADWPTYGHDLMNTRSAGNAGPSTTQVRSLHQAWAFKSSTGDFTGTPVIAGGVLVAGDNGGWVYALSAVTGKLEWSRKLGSQINGSAAIDDRRGLVFVPVANIGAPQLAALSLSSGAVRWDVTLTQQTGADVYASPVFAKGTVYIGTSGPNSDNASARGTLVALKEASGKLRWRRYIVPSGHDGGPIWSTPAIDLRRKRIYAGTGNAYHSPAANTTDSILQLGTKRGRILAHYQATPGDVFTLPTDPNGPDADFGASPNLFRGPHGQRLVGEGSKNGVYYALDRKTLHPVWKTTIGPGSASGGIIGSTAFDGTRIYGTDTETGGVWALGTDGSLAWSASDPSTLAYSPVAVGNGVLYTINPVGLLRARDARTGAVLSTFALGGAAFGGMSIVGGATYVSVGTGPPPIPGPQLDGTGSIIAYGDTSHSG